MTAIAIMGAAGKAGQAILRCAMRSGNYRVVAAIEQTGHAATGQDAGKIAGIDEAGVKISDDLSAIAQAEVAIDFSFHTATPENAKFAARHGVALVIGTTGLNDEEADGVRYAAERVPVVWAPNMSMGVNLLFAVVKRAASALGTGYRVAIDETHHAHKKDAPSGTALGLGRRVAEGRKQDFKSVMVHNPAESEFGELADKLVIRSRRIGEVVGEHSVVFENAGERIEFTHKALSRDAFAMGALRAADWVVRRRPGIYDMQDVLGLE